MYPLSRTSNNQLTDLTIEHLTYMVCYELTDKVGKRLILTGLHQEIRNVGLVHMLVHIFDSPLAHLTLDTFHYYPNKNLIGKGASLSIKLKTTPGGLEPPTYR